LVIAANRDEFLDRPSEGPALRGAIAAPRDVRAGGTWLGLSRTGVFAAVTNRKCPNPDPGRRSRGQLVLDALRGETADEAKEKLENLEPEAYNPFNLFVADRQTCFLVTYDGEARRIDLPPGAHVVGNTDPAAARTPKLAALDRQAAGAAAAAAGNVLGELAAICRGHSQSGDPLAGACVHAGAYGTRSSTLLFLADDEEAGVFRYADGPPCCTAYDDFTPLLRDLRCQPGYVGEELATRSAS
jgi:uncharacterized protein with NRDE domain